MKHIVFNFAEPIVAIQRVRNEVFPSDDRVITVYNLDMQHKLWLTLTDMHIACSVCVGTSQIILDEKYHIVCSAADDEFAIVEGKDEMRILTSDQYFEEFYL